MAEEKKTTLIAVDHGFSHIKTVDEIFETAITPIDEPISGKNVLQIGPKYYRIGGRRIDVLEDKTATDEFRLLTYVAIARQLAHLNTKKAGITLAVGLPIGRLAKEKAAFKKYLASPKEVHFHYSESAYVITIENVFVFPQCYGAVANLIPEMQSEEVVVDIGSWTIDTLYITRHTPDESRCGSDPNGLIPCFRRIDEECMKQYNTKLGETLIVDVIRGSAKGVEDKYITLIRDNLTRYTKNVFHVLREMGIRVKTTPITFTGGGALLMKKYAGLKDKNISYIDDIRANARGYDALARAFLKGRGIACL